MDKHIVRMLHKGYTIPFLTLPRLSPTPIEYPSYTHNSDKFLVLQNAVQEMLEKGALERIQDDTAGFYSRMFVVPKKNGKWRPIIDLSPLNKMIDIKKFRMETPASVLQAVFRGQWMTSIDLTDAYFHIPIKQTSRKYLRFRFQGVTYQFTCLCFGISTAPLVFTQVMKPIANRAHREGIRLHQYIDDWLCVAETQHEAVSHTQRLLQLIRTLGLKVNLEKSDLTPSTRVTYLGMVIDSVEFKVYPTLKRIEDLLRIINSFLQEDSQPVWKWLQILGHLVSLEKLVINGRRRIRPLQFQLKEHWKYPQDRNRRVFVTPECRLAVIWWSTRQRLEEGISLEPFIYDFQLFTDASKEGWGACVEELQSAGLWTREESLLHINLLEMEAVARGLRAFKEFLKDSTVAVMSDNTTVVSYLNKQGGTRSKTLCLNTIRLMDWADDHHIIIRSTFVPGRLNVRADALSRRNQILKQEWSLAQQVFKQICCLWETPQVDLFATNLNHKLPLYFSPIPDPQALGRDAMIQSWVGLNAYAYPPTSLIRATLTKIREDKTDVILIAPAWPNQSWYPELLRLLVARPRALPIWKYLLKQPHRYCFHSQPEILNLHAWKLSPDIYRRRDFLRQLPKSSQDIIENQLRTCINSSGNSSLIGVTESRLIRSEPLFQ